MGCRDIRVSSRALGPRLFVRVKVYDTVEEMRRAGEAFSGQDESDTLGLCQVWSDQAGRADRVIVRVAVGNLSMQIICHEMHHAATALYGAHVSDRVSRRAHLNHFNEPFAHLYSDLLSGLLNRLRDLGYDETRAA